MQSANKQPEVGTLRFTTSEDRPSPLFEKVQQDIRIQREVHDMNIIKDTKKKYEQELEEEKVRHEKQVADIKGRLDVINQMLGQKSTVEKRSRSSSDKRDQMQALERLFKSHRGERLTTPDIRTALEAVSLKKISVYVLRQRLAEFSSKFNLTVEGNTTTRTYMFER